jgi:hypothetical protein
MTDQYPQPVYDPSTQPKDSTLALVSMICGIAAYVFIPLAGAIAAVICGHMAKNEIRNSSGMLKGNGMATAGLILGYVQIGGFILGICAIVLLVTIMGVSFSDIFSNMSGSFY